MTSTLLTPVAGSCFLVALLAPSPGAQTGGIPREVMWRAPSEEEWKLPVLLTFQRTWEDALQVSSETNRPILICVNMDGEIASEHYAGVRYRQADIAALYEPYVCVIASVYRHSPRDYDEEGNRILCPRFGSVTCGEHITIEPILYEQFFEGTRVAPRHIMVELDGEETYDVYYAFDTDSVFGAVRDGIANREGPPPIVVRGDRTLVERVASRDVGDRQAVEQAFREGDKDLRRALLAAAAEHPDAAPVDLLRLAVFGFDDELARAARGALAETDAVGAVDLVSEALRVPMEDDEREALIGALERIGTKSTRARTLSVVHRGLGSSSSDVDVDSWSASLGGSSYSAAPAWSELEARLDDGALAASDRPQDADAQLAFAEASLALAVDPESTRILGARRKDASKYALLMCEDARRAALEAEKLGASGWRLDAVLALSSYYLGESEVAHTRAAAAVQAIPREAHGEWNAMGALALFAEARRLEIADAVREKRDWPAQWLTDVHSAYSILARHPKATDGHVVVHYDFLKWLGAAGQATRFLELGLGRFPESWPLHARLRRNLLEDRGATALEPAYGRLLAAAEGDSPSLEWFAGFASIVAAEYHRRSGAADEALAAYTRAIAHYDTAMAGMPNNAQSSDHYAAMALAGRARIAFERGDDEAALDELLASFTRRPEAAGTLDGLNLSPADTSRLLRARLAEGGRTELVARLDAALAQLDPALLELPDYEKGGPTPPWRQRRGQTQDQ